MAEYLTLAACHAAMTAAVFVVARALTRRIGRDSKARRVHGRYVLAWSVAAFALGPVALVAAYSEGPPRGGIPAALVSSYIVGMFFLLAGWAVGTVHGAVALVVRRRGRDPLGPAE